jgi:excinuclease UvrABC ATPase subunit
VAEGTPEEVAQAEASFTGQYLRDTLTRHAEPEKAGAK